MLNKILREYEKNSKNYIIEKNIEDWDNYISNFFITKTLSEILIHNILDDILDDIIPNKINTSKKIFSSKWLSIPIRVINNIGFYIYNRTVSPDPIVIVGENCQVHEEYFSSK